MTRENIAGNRGTSRLQNLRWENLKFAITTEAATRTDLECRFFNDDRVEAKINDILKQNRG